MVGADPSKPAANYASLTDSDKDGFASDIDANDSVATIYPFAGGNDSLATAVIGTSPANNATGVPAGGAIAVTFNKVVDQRTLAGSFALNDGATGSVSYNPLTRTATFVPAVPLVAGTQYTATVSTQLKDQSGKSLAAPYSWSFTTDGIAPLYKLSTTITGSGSINNVAAGSSFACAAAGCSQSYNFATRFTLRATPAAGFGFNGWSGACAAYGVDDCPLTLFADNAVGATFIPATSIRIGTVYYPQLQNAFDAAVSNAVIQAKALSFVDNGLVLSRPGIAVKLKGGYDSSFATNGGYTILDGKLSVSAGTLRAERLKIK
jgi:hypothetical protein